MSNYFVGADPRRWRTNVPTYARVLYHDVYPGVDAIYYSARGVLEYDLVVAPRASVGDIRLALDSGGTPMLTAHGDLTVRIAGSLIEQRAPHVYQTIHGRRHVVAGRYVWQGKGIVGVRVGAYNPSLPLVVDPVLVYSTYLGGDASDEGTKIVVDHSGAAYVCGNTSSTNFPTTGGAFSRLKDDGQDVFVSKLSADASHIVYSTYLDGSGNDFSNALALGKNGALYLAGTTNSTNFPTTRGALLTTTRGGYDAFVAELSADGRRLVYSTYLGGRRTTYGYGVAVDHDGVAYVVGTTDAPDFPVTKDALSTRCGCTLYSIGSNYVPIQFDAFVVKLAPDGTHLLYSTYLGGTSVDVASNVVVDGAGAVYVAGTTKSENFPTTRGAFASTYQGSNNVLYVGKFSPDGRRLLYSTLIGESGSYYFGGLAVDRYGAAYVTSTAYAKDFPATKGAFSTHVAGSYDVIVSKVAPDGQSLQYSTFLGGDANDTGNGIVLDDAGAAYIIGSTMSTNLPTTKGAFPIALKSGVDHAFVGKLAPNGARLAYLTYLGGNRNDYGGGIALGDRGTVYVVGDTTSSNFPTTKGAFSTAFGGGSDYGDVFVGKLDLSSYK